MSGTFLDAPQEKRKLIYIELLRIIAIYFVLFNHTWVCGYWLFSITENPVLYGIYLFLSISCKIAVPLFYMASGALLLGKEESIKDVYHKRVLKYIVILIVISFVYHIYDWHFNEAEFNIWTCLRTIYCGKAADALWYLYCYIGVLIMLPLLRRLVKSMRAKDYVYLLVCQIVLVGIIPIAEFLFSKGTVMISGDFSARLITTDSIFYFLMGYYMEHVLEKEQYNRKNALTAISFSCLAIILCCLMTWYHTYLFGEASQRFHNALIAIPTLTAFYCAKLLFMKKNIPAGIQKAIQFVGGTTFGIFLLETMLRERTMIVFEKLQPIIHTMPACLVWVFAACAVGVLITAVLKRLPTLGRYL